MTFLTSCSMLLCVASECIERFLHGHAFQDGFPALVIHFFALLCRLQNVRNLVSWHNDNSIRVSHDQVVRVDRHFGPFRCRGRAVC